MVLYSIHNIYLKDPIKLKPKQVTHLDLFLGQCLKKKIADDNTLTLCVKHTCMHNMSTLVGSRACLPEKFEIFHSEIESESIFSDYFTFQADLYNSVTLYVHGLANNLICPVTHASCSQLSCTREQIIVLNFCVSIDISFHLE